MKLVPLLLSIIAICIKTNAAQEHFTFPPHFHNQNPGIFSSDSSVYLPPESHTPIPYFPIKNLNKLEYPFLPPNNKNGHPMFPTPFPFIITSSLRPSDDNYEDDDENDRINTNHSDENKSVKQPQITKQFNRTERTMPAQPIRREMKQMPNNFKFSQQIDRNDMKPFPFATNNLPNTVKNTVTQTASPRSFIISPESSKGDQMKSGSFYTPQYMTTPSLFVSTTVEPAIPIIRLSNEMDLDGSFSYEALGADQTHYVQHSRMENFGTDKQEQVVEGSYSYVGDNGQTYTVHYVADSNGFRATGDHLPVAPPIPEIIQRAIQYNLAEEARNPPVYKHSWEYGNNENEISETEKVHRFAFSAPQNLFTGKTPESFSRSLSEANDNQNNLLSAVSTNTKTVEFTQDQMKPKRNAEIISPQITFLASQGAHSPSINKAKQQTQQTISRMFTTDKPAMPQLINYEVNNKDVEQENNKALWRWQYGLNADNNQSSNKNTISRSSGDDVIMNFNDMTADQYSKMIKTEIQEFSEQQDNVNNKATIDEGQRRNMPQYSTARTITESEYEYSSTHPSNSKYKYNKESPHSVLKSNNHQIRSDARAKLITLNEFLPPSQTITQSYDYIDNYEVRKMKSVEDDVKLNVIPLSKTTKTNSNNFDTSYRPQSFHQEYFMSSTPKGTNFTTNEEDQSFKLIITTTTEEPTTEVSLADLLKDNMFLKNIFSEKWNQSTGSNTKNDYNTKHNQNAEVKTDKSIKYFAVQARPFEEQKELSMKPISINDVLKYVSSKTNFESNKLRPRMTSEYNDSQKNENFVTINSQKNEKSNGNWNHQQHQELKGLIKNYKVLQRNKQGLSSEERMEKRISPPSLGNMQSLKFPPLGSAGPSMKSYLPPSYV